MKSEKEKLAAKSVNALKAATKRLGGKLVTPDGKAKTKVQLINTIVMKNRLAGKSMGGKATTKKKVVSTKVKKYDIGMYRMGNGTTIANRAEEEYGDYKNIAHISDTGILTIYDNKMPVDIKKMLRVLATATKKGKR